eukprot:1622744-Rhodomonas_salina.1
MQNLEIWRRLRDIAWLRRLPDAKINALSSQCKLQSFREGDVITRQGEIPTCMKIMHSGTATQHRKATREGFVAVSFLSRLFLWKEVDKRGSDQTFRLVEGEIVSLGPLGSGPPYDIPVFTYLRGPSYLRSFPHTREEESERCVSGGECGEDCEKCVSGGSEALACGEHRQNQRRWDSTTTATSNCIVIDVDHASLQR